ncbi:hypothetical protein [Psychrobacillus sp. L3]|uniref:hypothetical protein n=1 Tax=Psychrobacillus sp. L3 TaxID=3236891 RepID=UPI0036F3CCA1
MEKINNRKYAVTLDEFVRLGSTVERILKWIEENKYGKYGAEHLEIDEKLALRIIDGMYDWQWQRNKGVRVHNDTHIILEIYEMHELQKRMDETMLKIDW